MRLIFICLFLLLSNQVLFAQNSPLMDEGVQHCSQMRRDINAPGQISYYQYPSMNKYDMRFLRLDLNMEANSRYISGNAFMVSVATQAVDTFIVELMSNMTVDSVKINGLLRTYSQSNNHVFVNLATPINAGGQIISQIYYRGTANSIGMVAGTASELNFTASFSESYQAREWWPAKQILTDKIDSLETLVTTTIGNKVGSNGRLIDSTDMPGGKRRFRWKSKYPINYYLPSITVGNYMEYDNYAKPAAMAPDSILIQHYITNSASYLSTNKTNLDKTPRFVEKYSELFGLYPFKDEKYGHCQASIGGGMEHQTMSTMQSFGTTLISHELAHQWFGDNVTCATWNDIWLNEGFATYGEYLMYEKLPALHSGTAASYMQGVHSNVMTLATGSVYVPDASIYDENRIFSSRLSYNKGCAVAHNLRFEMGSDSAFFNALKSYQQQFKNSTATTTDLKNVCEGFAGKDLDFFFDQWVYGQGYPTINVTYLTQGLDSLILIVNENTSAPTITSFFKGLLELKITSTQGDTTIIINLQSNNQQFKIPYSKVVTTILIDPNNWMLNQTGLVVNGGAVPVGLTYAAANVDNTCKATISWRSVSEPAGVNYQVEYSTNGIDFSPIATVPGRGNSSSAYQYQFQLTYPGTSYVRIKLIDPNGNAIYSDMMLVNNNCQYPFGIHLSPNPASSHIKLDIKMPGNEVNRVSIINAAGETVYRDVMNLPMGASQVTIDTKKLPAGTYVIRCESTFGTVVNKFVKL